MYACAFVAGFKSCFVIRKWGIENAERIKREAANKPPSLEEEDRQLYRLSQQRKREAVHLTTQAVFVFVCQIAVMVFLAMSADV